MLAYQQTTIQLRQNPSTDLKNDDSSPQIKGPTNDQLAQMSTKIQVQLNTAIGKLSVIYKWTNSQPNSVQSRKLLQQYQNTVWSLLIEIDERLKELGFLLRRSIDSCNVKDPKLEQLLGINRSHVYFTQICSILTGPLNLVLEEVLEIRSRAAQIEGVLLSSKMVSKLEEMQEKIQSMEEVL